MRRGAAPPRPPQRVACARGRLLCAGGMDEGRKWEQRSTTLPRPAPPCPARRGALSGSAAASRAQA